MTQKITISVEKIDYEDRSPRYGVYLELFNNKTLVKNYANYKDARVLAIRISNKIKNEYLTLKLEINDIFT